MSFSMAYLSSGSNDGNGAKYWRLNDGSLWAVEERKSPCGYKGSGEFSD